MQPGFNWNLKKAIAESEYKYQIALAKDLEISEALLSKILNGWKKPTPELAEKIAELLKTSPGTLFPVR